MSNLREKYDSEVVPALRERFGYKNPMEIPRVEKVVLNMGVGEGSRDFKVIEAAQEDLTRIAGQRPVITRSKKSIANFKLREGMPVGVKVTLRRERMWEFLERFINIAVPRIRDFRGLPPKSFDGRGSHTVGIREHSIFLELDLSKLQHSFGMDITTVTTAQTDEEARELLRLLGMPFREN